MHHIACPRQPVAKLVGLLPSRYIEALEHNQQIAHCCRNPLDYGDIEAFYSSDADRDRGVPDIYVIHCRECGRRHRRFCVGGSVGSGAGLVDARPFWEVR